MRELAGKTAVVTGAASGIGRGLANRFVAEGMRVVLADVEEGALTEAEKDLRNDGADVIAVITDVSSRASVDALADAAASAYGPIHVLCNNAGVSGGGGGGLWQTTVNDWQWVLGVNFMGVVHGIQSFVPRMIEHGGEGHIVNTSSVLGLSTGGGSIYGVTKHAVTRLTEGLYHDLRAANSKIGVSVLCPGMIATKIITAERNRPDHLRNEGQAERAAAVAGQRDQTQQRWLETGMPPDEVGTIVVDAIRDNRFYILTHPDMIKPQVEARMRAIIDEGPPPGGQRGRRPNAGGNQ